MLFTKKRVPVVLQETAAECGLACIAMILNFHGFSSTLAELRVQFGNPAHGMKVTDLCSALEGLCLDGTAYKAESHELPSMKLPCIIHWEHNHFVVLEKIRRSSYYVIDPSSGPKTIKSAEFDVRYTGVAVEVTPRTDFAKNDDGRRSIIWKLGRTILSQSRALGVLLTLGLTMEAFNLMSPIIVQWLIDSVFESQNYWLLVLAAIGMLCFATSASSLEFLHGWLIARLSSGLYTSWRRSLNRHVLSLPERWFAGRNSSDIVARLEEIDILAQKLPRLALTVPLDTIVATATLALLFQYSNTVASVILFFTLIHILIRFVSAPIVKRRTDKDVHARVAERATALEAITSIRTIKSFGMEVVQSARNSKLTQQVSAAVLNHEKLNLSLNGVDDTLVAIQGAAVIFLGGQEIISGGISIGMFTALLSFKAMFESRMIRLCSEVTNFRTLKVHADRLEDILVAKGEPVEQQAYFIDSPAPTTSIHIELVNVSFQYSIGAPMVLKNIHLSIPAGSSIAITGPSGGGKSTLFGILAGILLPTSGRMLINGVPLEEYGLSRYRAAIGVVHQNDFFLYGTISENIAAFRNSISMTRIIAAAKAASIHEDIERLPLRFDTPLEASGWTFSGGQRQRLLLARAVYHQPSVLLLDEATSNLDLSSEEAVNTTVRELQVTRVCIAHRPQTIQSMDIVYELKNGSLTRL